MPKFIPHKHKIRVGITLGDPSGIGPLVVAKALSKVHSLAEFVVIGDKKVFDMCHVSCAMCPGVKFIDLNNVSRKNFSFGKVKPEYGRASIQYLDQALELIKNQEIDCLVTAPISKEAINLAGFHYSGHTEYLEKNTHTSHTVMMLLNKQLKFSLVTRHTPLKKVSEEINKGKVVQVIRTTCLGLRQLFLIKRPRIVVCGLNPHASDNGIIGTEENKIIKPCIKRLKRLPGHIAGPYPAEVAIKKAYQGDFDCVIAMYHDQSLIPLKLLGDESGVNLTLGLPFIRTSPLHGTAFDIAGTNSANPASMIAAIKLAIKCALNQKRA